MRKSLLIAPLALCLSGCATGVYWLFPPGGNEQQAHQDDYACMQEAQQQTSSAYVNPYGGAAQSGSTTNMYLYKSCMYARGYREGQPPK